MGTVCSDFNLRCPISLDGAVRVIIVLRIDWHASLWVKTAHRHMVYFDANDVVMRIAFMFSPAAWPVYEMATLREEDKLKERDRAPFHQSVGRRIISGP